TDEGAFEMRLRHASRAKQAIARDAASLVRHGDVIAMDSSTTCYYLAHELLDRRNLVVVTNGLRAATLFMEQSSAMVLMPGGVLRRSAGSMVGPIGDVLAGRGRIEKGFFGLVGLSTSHGLLDIVVEEAQTKQFLARACDQVYGLFDSSKVGRFGVHSFAATDTITALCTDDGVSAEVVAEWADVGVPVRTVPVSADVIDLHAPLPNTGRPGR
ncbi:MAG: DeoR/GlpR family DNA-binding transcription regulator, partial [Sciscionella sp.]